MMHAISSTMLSPLVSWILSPSSSSSSSEEDDEENLDNNIAESDHENNQKDNVEADENDHFLSSCDVDDAIPVALAVPDNAASPVVTVAFPATTVVTRSKGQRANKYSGAVRQYQRLWTKQDEVEVLKGYLDYIKQNGRSTISLQNDVASLYDHVKPKLNVGFNKNQLVEKLRRLKRKHKVALDKGKEVVTFKSPHEQTIFEISHKIWGNDNNDMDQDALDGDESEQTPDSHGDIITNVHVKTEQVDNCDETENRVPKRQRLITDDANRTNNSHNAATTSMQGFIEDTMRSCFPPLMKELLDDTSEAQLGGLTPISMPSCPAEAGHDEQQKKRKILELEVYLNRLEMLHDQIKIKLEELRSSLA